MGFSRRHGTRTAYVSRNFGNRARIGIRMEYIHVFPINDLVQHNTEQGEDGCICNPKYEHDFNNDTCLVIHSSLDRRECFENADRNIK